MSKEKPHRLRAVAMRYEAEKDAAPRMVAKGAGYVAEKIIAVAKENNVPLHHDPDLVAALSMLDIRSEIPEDLYKAMAEVLAFVYRLNKNGP